MLILKKSSTLLIFLLVFNLVIASVSKEIPKGISLAFRTGNSKELVKFFNTSIELVILEKEDVYTETQAERIISDFFAKYPPKSFIILHQGGKETSQYAIGDLITSKGVFRVYFLLKTINGNPLIHQLRIEKEDE
jgi:hypothetical protein